MHSHAEDASTHPARDPTSVPTGDAAGRVVPLKTPGGFARTTLAAHASVSQEDYLAGMRCLTNGVHIVTTDGTAGRHGLTVSAMISLSASPPLLLVSIRRTSPVCGAVQGNGRFAVNALNAWQHGLANSFAGLSEDGPAYDFGKGTWRNGRTGSPLLADALATFDCQVVATHDHGDHTVIVGRVLGVASRDDVPLLYGNRAYQRPHPLY